MSNPVENLFKKSRERKHERLVLARYKQLAGFLKDGVMINADKKARAETWAREQERAISKVPVWEHRIFKIGGVVALIWAVLRIGGGLLYQDMSAYLRNSFGDRYTVTVEERALRPYSPSTLVVTASDRNAADYCPKIFKNKDLRLSPPVVSIYEKRPDVIWNLLFFLSPYRKIFEFEPILLGEEHAGSPELFIYKTQVLDIDNDGNSEIVARFMTPTCGSSAEIIHAVIGLRGNHYDLVATLPDVGYFEKLGLQSSLNIKPTEIMKRATEEGWQPKSLFDEEVIFNGSTKLEVRYAASDDFIEFKDLNNDGTLELVVAKPVNNVPVGGCFDKEDNWNGKCECHWCPHQWSVGVYRYHNGEFVVDNNFNGSLLLLTPQKYDFYDIHGYRPLPTNPFGVISPYYGLGFFIAESKITDFDYSQRTTSKIWQIVASHYHN